MANPELTSAFIEICQVKARYCRALDAQDWDTLSSCFTEDYVLDISEDTGIEPIHGRDAAVASVRKSLGGVTTAHQVHVPVIELDGDGADVIWALQDRLIWDPPRNGLAGMTGYGEYHERWRVQNGKWKIARLRLTRFHIDFEKVE